MTPPVEFRAKAQNSTALGLNNNTGVAENAEFIFCIAFFFGNVYVYVHVHVHGF